MGVLEFFGTLIKNNITTSAIQSNFIDKQHINHFFLDFNSIIHVSSQKILTDVNTFMELVLKNLYHRRSMNNIVLTELFTKYGMEDIQKEISTNTDPTQVVKMFKEHFTDKYMDKLIITLVINTTLQIIRTYCENAKIKTLMIAIDGVPSKGKLIEQKQRRYLGAIMEEYKKKILLKYKDYLLEQEDNIYIATSNTIKWSRNKITPGTVFMHKLSRYLKSEKIQSKIKINRQQMKIVISDMYEIGEGEKKIVNYIKKYLPNTNDSVMIYSPDADVILLCIILPVKKMFMLRHNQQTSAYGGTNIYDLIDINMLKSNISYYINNHPNYAKENFDTNRINYDLVCLSTLFGNDFVPKMETLNVKKGFQSIMDAYLKSLIKMKENGFYLVKQQNSSGHYGLNFTFLKCILRELIPEETDFIKHNNLYNKFINVGQIKNVFNYMEINMENIVTIYNNFRNEYENFKNIIKNDGDLLYYESNDQFMSSLKKSINMIINNQSVNTTYMTNTEFIDTFNEYFIKYREFPRLNINLNEWSHSSNDYMHKNKIREKKMNEYKKELYKFDNLLDEYHVKFNHQPLDLSKNKISDYYKKYFQVTLYDEHGDYTPEANNITYEYLEGILWVFNYYFNDTSYVNRWYYKHERVPLMKHLITYLESIKLSDFKQIYRNLVKYRVSDIKTFFTPIEQLIYVSPMTEDILKLLPLNYRTFIMSGNIDPFLKNYFVDIHDETDKLWNNKISPDVDCRGISFMQKCIIKAIHRATINEDKQFIKSIRKVEPSRNSKILSKNTVPDY